MLVDIVLGCSDGNEGKGKVIYDLLKNDEYDLSVRFNGSNNKSTIYYNNNKIIINQLPIGILSNSKILICNCLINIDKLKEEIEYIESFDIDIKDRLLISNTCQIEDNETFFSPKRVEDFKDIFIKMGFKIVNMKNFWEDCAFNRILLEGADGFELDENWTSNYSYNTFLNCTLASAINIGIPLYSINIIYGVTKCYETYTGPLNFQPNDNNLDKIAEYGKEYDSITGEIRQCNYLNLNKLNDSLRINYCNICIINKCDILNDLNIFKLYYNNELLTFNTINEMKDFIDKNIKKYIIYSDNPYVI